jgi:hypothetical protein
VRKRKIRPLLEQEGNWLVVNAGFGYLEVKCLGCNTHQTVALDIVRRPKTTPVHELERTGVVFRDMKSCGAFPPVRWRGLPGVP